MRSRHSVKPETPLSKDPVEKLEGLGARTKLNLSDVRACVRHIDGRVTVPIGAPNKITTGKAPKLNECGGYNKLSKTSWHYSMSVLCLMCGCSNLIFPESCAGFCLASVHVLETPL